MGFFKKLFGVEEPEDYSADNASLSNKENLSSNATIKKDYWRDFFGVDLKNAPNAGWTEIESEYSSEGKLIRNFELDILPDSYFTKVIAKVIDDSYTNFIFTGPYDRQDAIDIFFVIERDFIHNGDYYYKAGARKFMDKFENDGEMYNWEDLGGCSIMLSKDILTDDIGVTVWTNFYNKDYMDSIPKMENGDNEPEDEDSSDVNTDSTKIIKVHLPSIGEILVFLKDFLEEQIYGNNMKYFLRPEDDTVCLLDTETFDEVISFECPEVTSFLNGRMAAITFINLNTDDMSDITADMLISPVSSSNDNEDSSDGSDKYEHEYYDMSYLVDPEEIDYRHKTIMDGTLNWSVVGIQHRENYEEFIERIEAGTHITLKPDPTNPYDPNALGFYLDDGTLIGYLPKKDQPFARIFFAKGQMEGEISEIDEQWLDSIFVLSPNMVDKKAYQDSEVRISKVVSKGISQQSQTIDIDDLIASLT